MAVAQLSPASSISWSTLKPYSLKSSSSIFWASSCLWSSNSSVWTHTRKLHIVSHICVHRYKPHPRYLMLCAMVDAGLLKLKTRVWLLAAAGRGHVPDWASTAAAREVTRKPIPTRVRTLNIQVGPRCWNREQHSWSKSQRNYKSPTKLKLNCKVHLMWRFSVWVVFLEKLGVFVIIVIIMSHQET